MNIQALFTACDKFLCTFVIDLRHQSLTTAWWHPSLHCFWSVCHPKISSILGTSENHLVQVWLHAGCWSINLCECYVQTLFTFWMTFLTSRFTWDHWNCILNWGTLTCLHLH